MDDKEEKNNPRNYLQNLYDDIKKETEENCELGADILKTNREIQDIADFGLRSVELVPDNYDWETSIEVAEHLKQSMPDQNKIKYWWLEAKSGMSTAGTVSLTSSTASFVYIRSSTTMNGDPKESRFIQLQNDISNFMNSSSYEKTVVELMMNLGFKKATRGKTAIKKFISSWYTHRLGTPTEDPAQGPLLLLRESIRITISELIRRLPVQKKTPRKIVEIGTQMKSGLVLLESFGDMEPLYEQLNKQLSLAKDEVVPRNREFELMVEGTLFLHSLLNSIDPKKIK